MSKHVKVIVRSKSAAGDFAQSQSLKNKNTEPKEDPFSQDDEDENGSPAPHHHQFMAAEFKCRKCFRDNLMKRLSEIETAVKADYDVRKQNGQKFKKLTDTTMKWNEKTMVSRDQQLKGLAAMKFTLRSDDVDSVPFIATERAKSIEDDTEQLEQRLAETTKRGWGKVLKSLRKTLKRDFH